MMGKFQNHFYKTIEQELKDTGKDFKIRIIQQKLYLQLENDIVQLMFFQEKSGTDDGYQATPHYESFQQHLSIDGDKVDTLLAAALALATAAAPET